ncbi:MAG: porin [Rubrivivax sp.]|jgi:predicted porin|nr:porin [Rubrivivax sp.]
MKRTLIVAAIAMLTTGAALAQSSVTVYGRLNLTVEKQKFEGDSSTELVNSASRIGFKGTEDLGGGLKAGFVLEHGFSPDDGKAASTFWGRQSEVNLSGGFGTVRLGTFTSEAYFATSDYIGMHNHETGTSSDALYAYVGRNINKVAYRTPELVKGMTVEAAVSLVDKGVGADRNIDIAVNYGAGPLHVGFGYEKGDNDAKQFAFSGTYEMGSLILAGLVQRDTDGWGAGLGSRTNFRAAVAYMMGASELHFNYGRSGAYSKLSGSSANQLTLGYNYNLSKRTKVYGYFTKTTDDKKVYGFGGDFQALAAGLRHNF